MNKIRPNLCAMFGLLTGAYIGSLLGNFEGMAFVLGFAFVIVFSVNLIGYIVSKRIGRRS